MDTKEELQEQIKLLQESLKQCTDPAQAIHLQKQLIDLMVASFKNKDLMVNLVNPNS